MQDIRSGLRERLEATKQERDELSERLERLRVREQRIRDLLEEEELDLHRPQQMRPLGRSSPYAPAADNQLKSFVLESLADGQEWSLDQLKEHARGIGLVRDRVSGRSLNITLVNLHRSGRVRRLPNGRWRLCGDGPQMSLDFKRPPSNPSPEGHSDAA